MTNNKDCLEFLNILQKKLDMMGHKSAETLVENFDYSCLKEEDYEKFILFILQYLDEKTEKENINLFLTSKKILVTVSNNFSPETVILELIQKIPDAKDDLSFLSLLEPLQNALIQIPIKRNSYLIWSLNSLQKYVEKLEISHENLNLSDEEKILMDNDDSVHKITQLLQDLMPFYDNLLQNIFSDKWKSILGIYFLKHLGHPLAYFDLTASNSKSRARRIAELIVEKYVEIQHDVFSFLNWNYKNEDLCPSELSVAILYYLILVEKVCIEKVPQVYNHLYVFQNSLQLPTTLLSKSNEFTVDYGLKLANVLLNRVQNIELPYNLLDSNVHSQFCKSLVPIIIYDNSEGNRKEALRLLTKYLNQFEIRGKYLIIYNLINVVNHTGLISFLITEYKQMLAKELDEIKTPQEISPYFSGQKLNSLIKKVCYLNKKEESDLVELSDQIIAALNLLRYLIIRDKDNVTKIWNFLPGLENYYFEPLKKGLMLSRAHYELKIKEVNEEKSDCKESNEFNVTVGKETLPSIQKQEKLQVLYSSLTAFDVIESILCRVRELITSKI